MILEGVCVGASDDKVTKQMGAWFGKEKVQGMQSPSCSGVRWGKGAHVPLSEGERTGRWQKVPQRKEEGNSAQWRSLSDRGLV